MSAPGRSDLTPETVEHRLPLLRSILALRHFTLAELSAYSGVGAEATSNFLRSCERWLEATPAHKDERRWHMRLDAGPAIKSSITEAAAAEARVQAAEGRSSGVRDDAEAHRRNLEDWYYRALNLVEDVECSAEDGQDSEEVVVRHSGEDESHDAAAAPARRRGLAAASMYLARCEATVWSQQLGVVAFDAHQLARLAGLRHRITALSGRLAIADDDADALLLAGLQDWSASLPQLLTSLSVQRPQVVLTFSDQDLAHWIASDLGLATPWYRAAARAVAVRDWVGSRWPGVQAALKSHCMGVLRLPTVAPALASISLIAATLDLHEISTALLGALLLEGGQAIEEHDRRVVEMAMSRLAQAPGLSTRVHLDAALGCELMLTRQPGSNSCEALLSAVVLKDLVSGRPWMDRVLDARKSFSEVFYRCLVKSIFIAARDVEARRAVSASLATDVGYQLVRKLLALQVAQLKDSDRSHLLIPCTAVLQSLQACRMPGQSDLEYLELPFPPESDQGVQLTVLIGTHAFREGMAAGAGGAFSNSIRTRSVDAALARALFDGSRH